MSPDKPSQDSAEVETPSPELLHQADETVFEQAGTTQVSPPKRRRGSYRPNHKATLVGLAVILVILAINVAVVGFILKGKSDAATALSNESVTLSPATLDTLGVSKTAVGDLGTELIVGPNSRFRGTLVVGGDVSVGGQLKLNSTLNASNAKIAKLESGDTSVTQININGDATASTLNLRKDLNVAGSTRLQGPVTISQLTTINNNLNVTGSMSVGGTLTVRTFQATSLTSEGTLTIGGHVVTRGSAPSVSAGSGIGSNGTVSISGNDTAGTVAVNVGVGSGGGTVANISFSRAYSTTPHVVITAIGGGLGSTYVSRTSSGFSIGVNGSMPPGGYAFDYIVMQ